MVCLYVTFMNIMKGGELRTQALEPEAWGGVFDFRQESCLIAKRKTLTVPIVQLLQQLTYGHIWVMDHPASLFCWIAGA